MSTHGTTIDHTGRQSTPVNRCIDKRRRRVCERCDGAGTVTRFADCGESVTARCTSCCGIGVCSAAACSKCSGSGTMTLMDAVVTCPKCGGSGEYRQVPRRGRSEIGLLREARASCRLDGETHPLPPTVTHVAVPDRVLRELEANRE